MAIAAGMAMFGLGALLFGWGAVRSHYVPMGILAVCCAILAGFAAFSVLAPRRPWIVDEAGFTATAVSGQFRYRWVAIGPIRHDGDSIVFNFEPGRAPRGRVETLITAVSRALAGADRSLPNNTNMPTGDLVRLLNENRSQARGTGR
jgi:hypothetical protein